MKDHAEPSRENFHTITPNICVKGAERAIEFYKKALGAVEIERPMLGPGGKIIHAELKIGDSVIFLSDEFSEMPGSCRSPQTLKGSTCAFYLYVPDVDLAFAHAVDAGGKVNMPVTDMFWGDRYGQILDPFGHIWGLATRTEALSPAQVSERQRKFFSGAK